MTKLVATRQLRSLAPPAWVAPVANADSIAGGVVGQAQTITAATLLANDTHDSRGTLAIQSVQNPIGCTVALNSVTQVITVTPVQVTPVSFQYTIVDTNAFTASATVTLPSVAAAPPPAGVPQKVVGPPQLANPTVYPITAPGTYILNSGTDYRVTFPSTPIPGQVRIQGGNKVHIGWGPTPSDYGGEIVETTAGTSCLIVQDQQSECWIEGMLCRKSGTTGHCFQIRCLSTTFPVYVLNCFADQPLPVNTGGGGSALSVHDGVCPKLTVDGFTFVTYGTGIANFGSGGAGSYSQLVCNNVYGHYGVNASRLIGMLYEIPATASFATTWAVDDSAPTAAISSLVSGGSPTVDGSGNLNYSGSVTGQITKGTSPNQFPASSIGTAYVQPGYTTAPPPPWVNPVANADSIAGGTVGQALTISAATVLANDTVDSRSALTIQSVQAPIGCTVSITGSTITMTPTQVTPVSFTYTVIDTQSNTATATVTFPSVSPAVVANNPPIPDLGPGLDASNSTLQTISAAGTYTLTAGVDYRVQFTTAITGQVKLTGGRKVHVGWGPTATDYGGEITETTAGTSCLIVEDMSQSCWIEGMLCDKAGTTGHCFRIHCTNFNFPVYVLNCCALGAVPVNTGGGGAALAIATGVCPKLTVDGFTFITYGTGIGRTADTITASITQLICNHVYGHWGVNAGRLKGILYEVPASASFTDSWAVDDASPTAAIAPLVSGGVSTTDASGNLNFTGSATGRISKGTSPNEFASAKVGTAYVQPGYTALEGAPASGPLPIFLVNSGSTVSDTVKGLYNALNKTYVVSQNNIDLNEDGIWDGKNSAYTGQVAAIPSTFTGPVSLDWEHWVGITGGFLQALCGHNGTAAQKTQALTEALQALNAYKGDRPNALWGYYSMPLGVNFSSRLNNSGDFVTQITYDHNLWTATDAFQPSCYCICSLGSTTDYYAATMTQSDLKKWQENVADQTLKCIANGGGTGKFYPYVSRHYYGSGGAGAPLNSVVPDSWIYWHVYYVCQYVLNGKKADGVIVWDKSGSTAMTEGQLKAVYQGLNGLPFDPNMPRPT